MSMEEKQNQNAGQPENKAKIEPVIRKDRQLKYTGNILKIYEDTVIANGHEAHWDYIHHDGAAAVVAVADDGQLLMVRQYRNALDRETLEIPAGKLDAPEEPKIECAYRELEEETGYTILDVRTAQEYSEKHIPGAINIANESIGTEDIPELPDKDQLILVYCRSGNRSKQASEKLVKLGYTNIVEIGGINSWPGETVAGDK